jgi:acyl-coenzyme A thioesterase PaaI-like protein
VAYPRPVPAGARVRFAAQVVHLGRAFGVVRVTANHDDNGKLFAIATVTLSP